MKIYTSGTVENAKLSGLYQGNSMTGKTHMMCTWPKPVLVSADPDTQTAQKLPGVQIIEISTWAELESEIVPYVKNRALHELVGVGEDEVGTFCLDTISIASTYLAREIQGAKPRLTIQDFGLFLNKLTALTMQCVEARKDRGDGAPCYNILFSTHLKDITNDSGGLEKVAPAVMGQFAGVLPRLFGFCFLCENTVKSEMVPGGAETREVPLWQVRTVPPSPKYTVGDRIGGGDYNLLPTVCDGTYPELMKLWGLKEDE